MINQISVSFNEPVVVAADALRLLNSTNAVVPLATTNGLVYDTATNTAKWTLATPLPLGKFLINLDA